jgi:HPr kinase/phosphorylase
MIQVHGTCVELAGLGVLLRGPSGSGKSDLALRLIDRGARLVADDRVDLRASAGALAASAPEPIAGRMEVRGIGILAVPTVAQARLGLVVDLVEGGTVERLPEAGSWMVLGISVPVVRLAPFEASAAAKVRLAARSFGRTLLAAGI